MVTSANAEFCNTGLKTFTFVSFLSTLAPMYTVIIRAGKT